MQKQKQYNIEDTNVALIGSKLDKQVKKAAAQTEAAWNDAGKEVGLQIWRIEKFQVVAWPKKEYGNFFSGDSYIVLNTYKKKKPDGTVSDALSYDVHFWLGDSTSQDEAGTAAYKTVELDTLLDDVPVQHREVEGFESGRFLSYFPKMCCQEGGVDSGFNHVEPTKYRARLLQIKGKGENVAMFEVECKRESLNSGDAFLLDMGLKLFLWTGSDCTRFETLKGKQLLDAIKDERAGKPEIFQLNQKEAEEAAEFEDFWKAIGGKGDIKGAEAGGKDEDSKPLKTLLRLSDGASNGGKQEEAAAPSGQTPIPGKAPFDAAADAEALRKAMKKFFGKDSKTIVDIFHKRSQSQLSEIAKKYNEKFSRDFAIDLKKKTSGDFYKVLSYLMMSQLEYDTECLHEAFEGSLLSGKDHDMVIELLCTRTEKELMELKENYRTTWGDLDHIMKLENEKMFNKDYKALITALLKGGRADEAAAVNAEQAAADAQALYKAGEGKFFGTDEAKFIEIMSQRSFKHLNIVFKKYVELGKKHNNIQTAIRKETSGLFRKALMCLAAKASGELPDYYARRLMKSMKGLGTNEFALTRIFVTQRGESLSEIKTAFYRKYAPKTLTDWIKGDTSGDYRAILLAMLGEENVSKYSLTNPDMSFTEVPKKDGKITRDLLTSDDVYIFDTGFEIFVWLGRQSSKMERKYGLQYGQMYLNKTGKPQHTPISRILEGGENEVFELLFDH